MEFAYEPYARLRSATRIEFDGFEFLVKPEVYEPREDSFLLAKAVQKFACGKFLDVGCGCGIQSVLAAGKPEVTRVVGVDVSGKALRNSWDNAVLNGVAGKCSFTKSFLFSAFADGETFDTIAFNSPYLPTAKDEKVEGVINKSWDGGRDGRRVLEPFLERFPRFLVPGGQLLLLSSSLSNTSKTVGMLHKRSFSVQRIASEKLFFEELVVLRARRVK